MRGAQGCETEPRVRGGDGLDARSGGDGGGGGGFLRGGDARPVAADTDVSTKCCTLLANATPHRVCHAHRRFPSSGGPPNDSSHSSPESPESPEPPEPSSPPPPEPSPPPKSPPSPSDPPESASKSPGPNRSGSTFSASSPPPPPPFLRLSFPALVGATRTASVQAARSMVGRVIFGGGATEARAWDADANVAPAAARASSRRLRPLDARPRGDDAPASIC